MMLLAFIISCMFTPVLLLDNGLALTPPMGWLSWTRFGCNTDCDKDPDFCVSEKLIMQMANHLAADGYLEAGYEYVSIDDCWLAPERDENGKLQPDPKRFPSGIKALADYVHSKGLKLGIYEDFGTKTRAGFPGSEFYLELDAKTFSEWGIDLLKFDTCHSNAHDNKYGYPAMARYLNQTGRSILFSCEWPYGELQQNLSSDYGPVREYCNIWRNYWDVYDSYQSIKDIVSDYGKHNQLYQKYTGPGGFFDPDMILAGNFGTSIYQQRAQMAMWAMFSAPLIMSNDLRDITPEAKELLLNKLLISVDQDPLGQMASKLWELNNVQLWIKPITPKGSFAITYLNTGSFGSGVPISVTASKLGLTSRQGYKVVEVFTGKDFGIVKHDTVLKFRKALPVPLKQFHNYNTGPIFNVLLAILRPALPEKMKIRVFSHGHSMVSVYREVDKSFLPDEYLPDDHEGPSQGTLAENVEYNIETLLLDPDRRAFIKDLWSGKYGADIEKRPVKEEGYGSFRMIER